MSEHSTGATSGHQSVSSTGTPVASIVVPCYNAERYLHCTLESALAQTMEDFELICVDNNSTDKTPDLLEEYAAADSRVKILSEPEPGEGPARDAGLKRARGRWAYFLDSDDLMEPTLLEKSISLAEDSQADIVVFQTNGLNDQTGEVAPILGCIDISWLPPGTRVFDPHEYPQRIFNSFKNWVHNKLFSMPFVHTHDLHFQHVHRSADILFTCSALAHAERIAPLEEYLNQYRVLNRESAMQTSSAYPLDFLDGFLELSRHLKAEGIWTLYRTSYTNWLLEGVAANIRVSGSIAATRMIVDAVRSAANDELELTSFPTTSVESAWLGELLGLLLRGDVDEILSCLIGEYRKSEFDKEVYLSNLRLDSCRLKRDIEERDREIDLLRSEVDALRKRTTVLEDDLANVRSSASFKIGRGFTAPLRCVRDIIRRHS